jgi:hypothetical protein
MSDLMDLDITKKPAAPANIIIPGVNGVGHRLKSPPIGEKNKATARIDENLFPASRCAENQINAV